MSITKILSAQKRESQDREGAQAANCNQNWGSGEDEKVLELIAFTISELIQPENGTELGSVLIMLRDRCVEDMQEMFLSSIPASAHFCTKALGGQVS